MTEKLKIRLMPHEWLMLSYTGLTLLFMLMNWSNLVSPGEMFKTRGIAMAVLVVGIVLTCIQDNVWTRYLRITSVLTTLSIWYPDTFEINRLYPSLDHIFAQWDQSWFGCQPSLLFSQVMPQKWFSELCCLGYWSYFPMIYIIVSWVLIRQPQHCERVAFVVLGSFFLYYLVYMFVPVGGPQFYYAADGVDPANGVFPALGRYFSDHQDLYPMPGEGGFFRSLVELAQQAGERPTAAFPSSHIGISTIVLLICRRYRLKIFFACAFPLYLCLCCATVYIHAHYLVDAIFGFISAFIVYWNINTIYDNIFEVSENKD